jgi:hypothetical protein
VFAVVVIWKCPEAFSCIVKFIPLTSQVSFFG